MEAFVERFRAKASKARQAQSRLKALEKMGTVDIAVIDSNVQPIHFPRPNASRRSPIINMEGVPPATGHADPVTAGPAHRRRRPDRAARRQRQRQVDLRQADRRTARGRWTAS
jgi:ATPase subunit of ABC transporter with duplicated ATPase domains